eukprot:5627298-Ditylum_brightwellii.AAC.1
MAFAGAPVWVEGLTWLHPLALTRGGASAVWREAWQPYTSTLWHCWGDMCSWVWTGTPCMQMQLRSAAAGCSMGGMAANSSLPQIVVHVCVHPCVLHICIKCKTDLPNASGMSVRVDEGVVGRQLGNGSEWL